MLGVIATLACGLLVGAALILVPRAIPAAVGAWTASGGLRRGRPALRAAAPRVDEAPVTPRRAALAGELFPTYLPGRGTSRDLAAALAQANGPVSVEHASAVCRALRVRAELRDLGGVVQGVIEADGTVRPSLLPARGELISG